jgi:hypothetical protein
MILSSILVNSARLRTSSLRGSWVRIPLPACFVGPKPSQGPSQKDEGCRGFNLQGDVGPRLETNYDRAVGKAKGKWDYRQYHVYRVNDYRPDPRTGLTHPQIEESFKE